jgi:hypothetical protein
MFAYFSRCSPHARFSILHLLYAAHVLCYALLYNGTRKYAYSSLGHLTPAHLDGLRRIKSRPNAATIPNADGRGVRNDSNAA